MKETPLTHLGKSEGWFNKLRIKKVRYQDIRKKRKGNRGLKNKSSGGREEDHRMPENKWSGIPLLLWGRTNNSILLGKCGL